MRAVPIASASLGVVWCIAALLHVPKREVPGVLAEVRPVLVPGGRLALAVQEGEGERWDGGYVEGVERFFARYTAAEMSAMLAAAGFSVELTEREVADSSGTGGATRTWLRFLARS
jgi:hypothetical protein